MAVNGVGMSGYFNYYSAVSQIRLQQALSKNPHIQKAVSSVNRVNRVTDSFKSSSADFLKAYNSKMGELMEASGKLRSGNSGNVMNELEAVSSDTAVAQASSHYRLREEKSLELEVTQLAQAQQNIGNAVNGTENASENMNFTISSKNGSFAEIQVTVNAQKEDGSYLSNREMLKKAALQINQARSGVKASVMEKDGQVNLQLESVKTGEQAAFAVNGETGAAKGIENAALRAGNAVYTVKEGGSERTLTSQTNDIRLDLGRIDVKLKSTGTSTISSEVNHGKVISAVEDLVNQYNETLAFLDGNAGHGQGVINQIGSFVRDLAPAKTMELLGLSTEKNGTLALDKQALSDSLKKDSKLVRSLISGQYGLAQKTFDRALGAMRENSGSLLSNDMKEPANFSAGSSYDFLNIYAKNGRTNMNNFYALGLMVNYLV